LARRSARTRRFVGFRLDERGVGERLLGRTVGPRPLQRVGVVVGGVFVVGTIAGGVETVTTPRRSARRNVTFAGGLIMATEFTQGMYRTGDRPGRETADFRSHYFRDTLILPDKRGP